MSKHIAVDSAQTEDRRNALSSIAVGEEDFPGISRLLENIQYLLLQQKPSGIFSRDVNRLVTAIHDKLFDPALNVKTLKAHCQIHDNNISAYFKLEAGVTLKRYIESMRMEAAGLLLRLSKLSQMNIAYLLGYAHIETFHRVFVRCVGCTPGGYRQSYIKALTTTLDGIAETTVSIGEVKPELPETALPLKTVAYPQEQFKGE